MTTNTSLLTMPSELTGALLLKGLIYGQPGVGKSTLALSSPNPVCIDFDRGMKRVRPEHRVPSLQVENYQQVLDVINGTELDTFDTIIFDTLGKLIDRICDYAAFKNPKARQGDGQMTMKGWGEVKSYFQALLKLLETKHKSILFVAHESEEKNGDETIKRPDCSGSARKDIVKELDFMGYMEMIGGKTTISFNPSDKYYAKNSLDLQGAIEVPRNKKTNDFISKEIFKLSEQRLTEQAELREQYDSLIGLITSNIAEIKTPEEANTYLAEKDKKQIIWDSHFYERNALNEHIKNLGFAYNRDTKLFEAPPAAITGVAAPGETGTTTVSAEGKTVYHAGDSKKEGAAA